MKRSEATQEKWKKVLWYIGCIIIVLSTVLWYKLTSYDSAVNVVNYDNLASDIFAQITTDSETNDSWETIMQLSEDPEDTIILTGMSCPASVANNSRHAIKDWTLRININQDCYLNGFWCGSIEVHQFREEEEIIDVVDSRNIDISTLKLECNPYSDVLMIHLKPGDYLVYLPSASECEDIVAPGNRVGIGFIFYYKWALELSEYELSYKEEMRLKDDPLFALVAVLAIVWIVIFVIYLYLSSLTKRMESEMNSRIRNMSIMAEIYEEVFLISVREDSAILIKGDKEKRIWDLEGGHVQENINKKICDSCPENYQAGLMRFLDLQTVLDRLNGVSHLVFEWMDESIGWCAIRLFRSGEDRKIVFALQDINEEKKKLSAVEERIRMAEFSQVVNGSFLGTVSYALNDITTKINQTGTMLMEKLEEEGDRQLVDGMVSGSRHLLLLQNTLFDMYGLESKRFVLNSASYSVHEMVEEIQHLVEPFADRTRYEYTVDVDPDIPYTLMGDRDRLEQILVILLFSSLLVTPSGFVKFSVFGKNYGKEEEMIFSIRDSAQGFDEGQIKEINAFIEGERIESFDNASLVYLKIINGILRYMGSELKVVSVRGEGSEFYFSLKQPIV